MKHFCACPPAGAGIEFDVGEFLLARPVLVPTFAGMLLTCQAGFESVLVRELADAGVVVGEHGPGWALAADGATDHTCSSCER